MKFLSSLIFLLTLFSASKAQVHLLPPPPLDHPDTISNVYTFVEQMPQYPGGDTALNNFLQKNIHFPAEAKQNGIEGTVYITFYVTTDGSIGNINILHDIGDSCGIECVRVVRLMPKWIPGKQNGNPVNVKYTLPVKFQLSPRQITFPGTVRIFK